MQFNDETNNLDLITDITFWTKADLTAAYLIAERTRNCNFGLDRLAALVLSSDGRWEWDDSNNTDLPIGRTNLVNGQRDYGISGATFLRITKVLAKDRSGTFRELRPIDKHDRADAKSMNEDRISGVPSKYDKMGNSIFLEPKPDYDSTGGLRVFFQRNVSYFVVGDTTKQPGFAQPFHRLISLYASEDYLAVNGIFKRLAAVQNKIAQIEAQVLLFYADRSRDEQPKMSFRKENYGAHNLKNNYGRNAPSASWQ